MSVKLSIVFLAWNGLNETTKALESIFRNTTIDFELILVDNGSVDGTQTLFDSFLQWPLNANTAFSSNFCKKVIVNHNPTNLGVSKGYNVGLKLIDPNTEYISIYSNDWICTPNWAQKMIACLESEPMCGLATACSNASATSQIDSRMNPNFMDRETINWNDPLLIEKVNNINNILEEKGKNKNNYIINQFVCMGWLMKKKVFDDVGLMDEEILLTNDVSYTYLAAKYDWISKTDWSTYFHHFLQVSSKQIPKPEQVRRDQMDWHRILSHPLYKK